MTEMTVAAFVVGLISAGLGGIFLWTDRDGYTTRALALALLCLGLRLSMQYAWTQLGEPGGERSLLTMAVIARLLEGVNILAGIEWARRIGRSATVAMRRPVNLLFRWAQGFALLYVGMTLVQIVLDPRAAQSNIEGFFQTPAVVWWLFLPVLGLSMLLSTVAIVLLLLTRTDPVESVRLRALALAGPFLLAGLAVRDEALPITLAIGLLLLLSGSIRYLIIQGQRGQLMSEFVSPELANALRLQAPGELLQRERRELSVVCCDLRGFTRYAREHDSAEVVTVLERFYQTAGQVAASYGGTVKDHAGDGLLILIGAPVAVEEHAQQAALLALELSGKVTALLQQAAGGLGIGIGVASGSTTVGAIQGAGRLEYVAVGTAVNLAARLCQRAEAGEILADQYTQLALLPGGGVLATAREPEPLKGFDTLVPVYALALAPALARTPPPAAAATVV